MVAASRHEAATIFVYFIVKETKGVLSARTV